MKKKKLQQFEFAKVVSTFGVKISELYRKKKQAELEREYLSQDLEQIIKKLNDVYYGNI